MSGRAGRTAAAWSVLLLAAALGGQPGVRAEDSAGYVPAGERNPTPLPERRLIQGFFDIRQGRMENALQNVSLLVQQRPDFQLAQLVYGDLLLSHSRPLTRFGHTAPRDDAEALRAEARARLQRYLQSPPTTANPACLLRLPASLDSALVIDLERYRLYVFERRGQRLLRTRDFYVSIGKGGSDKQREGDEKTPVGVYRVASYLPGERLPELYGVGAFPIDYPNPWDDSLGRSGSGIWIHGTEPDRYSRPPRSSRGCVTLSNENFELLSAAVEVTKTPVVVSRSLEWVDTATLEGRRQAIEAHVEQWRRDWESRDTDRYLSHYSQDFVADGMSRRAFADHKRRVNAGKSFIQIELEDVGIYSYPGEDGLVRVDFLQRYKSNNFNASRTKSQYWRREADGWRIVLEGGA